ncbi:MAG: polymer-forming cytoskeletal protein [Actinobacteria bacterium]|nr:polymer-forming cytoskeletal protein [Actinomycetota bacterium]MBM3711991.1 polymer-forming cytoskeletal protein [Actinomycetota bacterium]
MALSDINQKYTGEGERTLLTITGENAVIEGKFKVSRAIEIDCEVKGQLDVDGQLIIQRNGYVNADVRTIDAEVIGKYEGNMEATGNVEIKETGVVSGNIKTDSLIISKGGMFAGNVLRITEGEESPKKKGKYSRSYKEAKEVFESMEKEIFTEVRDDAEAEIADEAPEKDDDLSL